MKFSENWLRELVAVPADREVLVERLTMAGLEVDGVELLGTELDGVVVGEITAVAPHPDADRLRVCAVDTGGHEPLGIVCGAPNARQGLKAPLAMVGARLPGGVKIRAAKLRGVASAGMLCSARELALDGDGDGLMELPVDAAPGTPVAALLGLPDAAIEVGLTPNRPDCLGMQGLAREVAAQFGLAFLAPEVSAVPATTDARRGVRLDAGSACPRYLGRVIEGLDLDARTPTWMRQRLLRAGMRPLSLIVDVTNYVMLELGQPLHAFDADALEGDIVVRHAREGEALELLDGHRAELDSSFLVIADAARALAVAGVMGGHESRVTAATRNIFLESAHFAPDAIMGRARRLGLHTDASHRFERGVDPELPAVALERATALLLELAGGRAGPVCGASRERDLPQRQTVNLRRARLARVLGITVPDAEVAAILTRLGLAPQATDTGWLARAPSWRFDISREEDLIEEVARIHGYGAIPVRLPAGELVLAAEPETRLLPRQLALQAVSRDYHEAVCMAFASAELLAAWQMQAAALPLANPLSADQAVMRPSLLPGLVQALQHNLARQHGRVRLLECGHAFRVVAGNSGSAGEVAMLALAASGGARAEQWGLPARAVDFHDLKGDVESLLALSGAADDWHFDREQLPPWLHPGRAARVLRGDRPAGYLGELHPALLARLDCPQAVLVAELELHALREARLPAAQPVPRYPQVRRDLAIEVDRDLPWRQVANCVRAAAGPRLVDLRLFDRYQGPELDRERKSLAMGLILQDHSRTLTDEDVEASMRDVMAALTTQCAARLRG